MLVESEVVSVDCKNEQSKDEDFHDKSRLFIECINILSLFIFNGEGGIECLGLWSKWSHRKCINNRYL